MKILCYGDSNTYGYDPRSYLGDRYVEEYRWTDVLARLSGWTVVNFGMNGRALSNAHAKITESTDAILVMLGTNDLLQGKSAEEVTARMEAFIDVIAEERDKLIVVAPPKMQRGEWVSTDKLIQDSAALGICYEKLCCRLGLRFIDSTVWDIPMSYDGVHFTEQGHGLFAVNLYESLKEMGLMQ